MKIIINTSNLKKGGALQVAHSFLSEIRKNSENSYFVILSSALHKQITIGEFPENFRFYHYTLKPSVRKVLNGRDKFLDKFENEIRPDCILTIFGPSYWLPRSPQLLGYAIPHYVYPDSPYFKNIDLKAKIKLLILRVLHVYSLKKSNSTFWCETDDVKLRLSRLLKIDKNKIHTISNTYNAVFGEFSRTSLEGVKSYRMKNSHAFNFLTITSDYPHKNLSILKKIVPILRARKIPCKFFITIDEKLFKQYRSFKDYIVNLRAVSIEECPELYYYSDALFLPTFLECFSASYPEAMKMEKPILTSNLSFARDICGDAAEYFDPLSPYDIAEKIGNIIQNKERREFLVKKGKERLKMFETSNSRATKFLEICEQISNSK